MNQAVTALVPTGQTVPAAPGPVRAGAAAEIAAAVVGIAAGTAAAAAEIAAAAETAVAVEIAAAVCRLPFSGPAAP